MSTLIDCPSCQRKLRVPDEFLGKSVRCPTCGQTFGAPEPAAVGAAAPPPLEKPPAPVAPAPLNFELGESSPKPPPAEEPKPRRRHEPERDEFDDGWDDEPPRRRRRREFEPCPRCGDDVRRGAVVCPYCGLDLEEQGDGYTRRKPVRADAEPHRGGTVLALGIASLILGMMYVFAFIALPLGLTAWLMGRRDLYKMDEGLMDPNGRKKTKDGWLCGLVGTFVSVLYALLTVFYVIMMIFAQNQAQRAQQQWQQQQQLAPQPQWVPPQQMAPVPPAQPPAQLEKFRLTAPQAAIVLKPGETKPVTVSVQPVGNFRGTVTVRVINAVDLNDLTLSATQTVLPNGQGGLTINVTVKKGVAAGVREVKFRAQEDGGFQVEIPVRVTIQ
jgi:predicted Zn finger-like uncharacterized protein